MLLKEITYSVLELIRKGHIVDDESISLRLLELFVKAKRADFIQVLLDKGRPLPEQFYQYVPVTLIPDSTPNEYILKTSEDFPVTVGNRNGNTIKEVTSTDLTQYIFTLVNNNRFRRSGKSKFNSNVIFVTLRENDLLFTSDSKIHLHLTDVIVKSVLENPKDSDSFDASTDNYPITLQCYEYIKKAIITEDIRMFMAGVVDDVNDSNDLPK